MGHFHTSLEDHKFSTLSDRIIMITGQKVVTASFEIFLRREGIIKVRFSNDMNNSRTLR